MIYEIAVLVSRFPFSMAARSRLGLIKPTDKIITQKNIYLFQFNNYGSILFDFNFPVRLYEVGDRQPASQPGRASGFGFQMKAEVENPISLATLLYLILRQCRFFSCRYTPDDITAGSVGPATRHQRRQPSPFDWFCGALLLLSQGEGTVFHWLTGRRC